MWAQKKMAITRAQKRRLPPRETSEKSEKSRKTVNFITAGRQVATSSSKAQKQEVGKKAQEEKRKWR